MDVTQHDLAIEFERVVARHVRLGRSQVGTEPLGADVGEAERHLINDEFDHGGGRVERVQGAGLQDVEFRLVVGDGAEEPGERFLTALEEVPRPQSPVAEGAEE